MCTSVPARRCIFNALDVLFRYPRSADKFYCRSGGRVLKAKQEGTTGNGQWRSSGVTLTLFRLRALHTESTYFEKSGWFRENQFGRFRKVIYWPSETKASPKRLVITEVCKLC